MEAKLFPYTCQWQVPDAATYSYRRCQKIGESMQSKEDQQSYTASKILKTEEGVEARERWGLVQAPKRAKSEKKSGDAGILNTNIYPIISKSPKTQHASFPTSPHCKSKFPKCINPQTANVENLQLPKPQSLKLGSLKFQNSHPTPTSQNPEFPKIQKP